MKIPMNAIAKEIAKNQSAIKDLDEQKRVLTEKQTEHHANILSLEATNLAEWTEIEEPIDPVVEE